MPSPPAGNSFCFGKISSSAGLCQLAEQTAQRRQALNQTAQRRQASHSSTGLNGSLSSSSTAFMLHVSVGLSLTASFPHQFFLWEKQFA